MRRPWSLAAGSAVSGKCGGHGGSLLRIGPSCGSLSRSPPRQPCHYSIRFPTANPRLRVVSPVIGSGQACRCPGQGVRALWGGGVSGIASLLCFQRARGQSQSRPPSVSTSRTLGLRGHPRGPGPRKPPSGASHSQCTPQAPQAHACLKPVLSHLGTGSPCKETQVVGLWAHGQGNLVFSQETDGAALGAREDPRITPWGDVIGNHSQCPVGLQA